KVSAIAAPTAADPLEVVSPDAVVLALAVVLAVSVTSPAALCAGPGLSCALLATLLIVTATAGATVTPAPETPALAVVVVSSAAVALSEMSPLVTLALVPI